MSTQSPGERASAEWLNWQELNRNAIHKLDCASDNSCVDCAYSADAM